MNDRKKLFQILLENLKIDHFPINEEYKYIGTGNPFSDILIVGKEASISISSNPKQYEQEIINNLLSWVHLNDFNQHNIPYRVFKSFNPLYPYKGQLLKKDNGKNYGTSVTWMNYQKLMNYITKNIDNAEINFHENSFITEVNSTPSKKTNKAKTDSISFRKEHILSSDFFNSFPIVIISGVGYFKTLPGFNEIEQIFHVKYIEKKFSPIHHQPYWIHRNEQKSKLVINTHQLSNGIGDDLLRELAEEIINSGLLNK
jgi:hypothetical protein